MINETITPQGSKKPGPVIEKIISLEGSSGYIIMKRRRYFSIQLRGDVNTIDLQKFLDEITVIILKPNDVIVDFFYLQSINSTIVLVFHVLNQLVQINGYALRFIHAKEEVSKQFQLFTFNENVAFFPDLYGALIDMKSTEVDSNCGFIKAIVMATMKTLMVQTKIPCIRRKTFFKKEEKNTISGDISAISKMKVAGLSYICILTFPEKTYLKILSNLLGQTFDVIEEENQDAASELLNIILRQSKVIFNKGNLPIDLDIPYTHVGKEGPTIEADDIVRDYTFEKSTIFVIPFNSGAGTFNIELIFPNKYGPEDIQYVMKI